MPPIVKENEISTGRPETTQRPGSSSTLPGDTAVKQQPVALEVPVTVNGARTVDGSDKREPFSETTKTVLIFGNGAVIRLSSSVAPGQLLFLTNEKTKKEVVCQVVKSKNYRNVSGYVELEFTEPVVGFWGMRFPGDRIGSVPQPTVPTPVAIKSSSASGSIATPRPVARKVEAPVARTIPSAVAAKPASPVSVVRDAEPKPAKAKSVLPAAPNVDEPPSQKPIAPVAPLSSTLSSSFDPEAPLSLCSTPLREPVVQVVPAAPVSTTPEASVSSAPVQPITRASVLFDTPRASEVQASILEPAKTPPTPMTAPLPNLLALFEAQPAAPAVDSPLPVQVSADPETETLKHHTARLQEQLSSMMFSSEPTVPETVSVRVPHVPPVAENAAKVLETSKIQRPEPAPVESVGLEPLPVKSSLEAEELKIPAWLEPLARNAAAPSSTQELIEREKAKRLTEQQPPMEEVAVDSLAAVVEPSVPELPLPTFGNALPMDTHSAPAESSSRGSNKGFLFGAVAAGGLILAGGGWWILQQQSSGIHASSAPASNVESSTASLPVASSPAQPQRNVLPQANPPAQSNSAALTTTSARSNSSPSSLSVTSVVPSAATVRNSQPISNPANAGAGATTSPSALPSGEQPKKRILGEVHLAKPKVTPGRHAQNGGEPDAGIALTSDEHPDAETLGAGLAGGNKQPSAPVASLPVGGDVKLARLLSSVPPLYPTLAKNQRVSGNVLVDALIDTNGRVTTMKVVSGPTLLQQAAMDALKQWKYQPASLDGKPVAMHLTVTIQFRLQ